MSTSIMQAMACGLPVIASNILGITNLLTTETGILVENHPEAFQNAIVKLINEADFRYTLQIKAREFVLNNFTNCKMFKRYNSIIKLL